MSSWDKKAVIDQDSWDKKTVIDQAIRTGLELLSEGWSMIHCVYTSLHMLGLAAERVTSESPDLFDQFRHSHESLITRRNLPYVFVHMFGLGLESEAKELAYQYGNNTLAENTIERLLSTYGP